MTLPVHLLYYFAYFQRYKGTKNKQELIAQVKREMAEERERRQRGEKESFLDSDDECDVDNDGPVPRSNTKRRGTTDATLVVPFNYEDNENDAPSHLGKTDGGGGGASYSGRADGDCDAAEPDDGEIPGTYPFFFFFSFENWRFESAKVTPIIC